MCLCARSRWRIIFYLICCVCVYFFRVYFEWTSNGLLLNHSSIGNFPFEMTCTVYHLISMKKKLNVFEVLLHHHRHHHYLRFSYRFLFVKLHMKRNQSNGKYRWRIINGHPCSLFHCSYHATNSGKIPVSTSSFVRTLARLTQIRNAHLFNHLSGFCFFFFWFDVLPLQS